MCSFNSSIIASRGESSATVGSILVVCGARSIWIIFAGFGVDGRRHTIELISSLGRGSRGGLPWRQRGSARSWLL